MPIKKDLTDLPKASDDKPEGLAPDAEPRFAGLLAEKWRREEREAGDLPTAFTDARFRHSDAGNCARAIAYTALDLEPSDPMDLSGYWNTGLGSRVHTMWQEALVEQYPDAVIEMKVRTEGAPGAGHIDAVVTDVGGVTPDGSDTFDTTSSIELKTVGGFAFKMAVGERGAAQGPKEDHMVQAALNALAADADEAVIVYLSKEAISVNAAERKGFSELGRFVAEWTIPREVFEPMARQEAERITDILELLDSGELPKRRFPTAELPKGHEIVDPTTGRWEVRIDGEVADTGTWWACNYCKFQTLCAGTEAGRIPVTAVTEPAEVA